MPDVGFYHPLVIHFVIALLIVGVAFRWASFTGYVRFAGGAAIVLIALGAIAAVIAVRSGEDASVAVEALPGTGAAIAAHRWWATTTRNIFLLVLAFELVALSMRRSRRARLALAGSGLAGLIGVVCLVNTGRLGGDLVYSHAGGVGVRSGDPQDVARLLLAGLYQQSDLDLRAGRSIEAADLTALAAKRFPNDPEVQMLAAESLLRDRNDPAAALATLERIAVDSEDRRLRLRRGMTMADAFERLGDKQRSQATLESLHAEFPDSDRVRRRLAALERSSG